MGDLVRQFFGGRSPFGDGRSSGTAGNPFADVFSGAGSRFGGMGGMPGAMPSGMGGMPGGMGGAGGMPNMGSFFSGAFPSGEVYPMQEL